MDRVATVGTCFCSRRSRKLCSPSSRTPANRGQDDQGEAGSRGSAGRQVRDSEVLLCAKPGLCIVMPRGGNRQSAGVALVVKSPLAGSLGHVSSATEHGDDVRLASPCSATAWPLSRTPKLYRKRLGLARRCEGGALVPRGQKGSLPLVRAFACSPSKRTTR